MESGRALSKTLDADRFFLNLRPYFHPHRAGRTEYRGARTGDFAAVNAIDVLLGPCSPYDPFCQAVPAEKHLYLPPGDQTPPRDIATARPLLDSFLRETVQCPARTRPAPGALDRTQAQVRRDAMIGGVKVLVLGASGTIGRAVVDVLAAASHEVISASRTGPVRADLEDPPSLDALFTTVKELDAVVCCAASGPLVALDSTTDTEMVTGMRGKLLGQVALAQRALHHLRDGGSITLTGGTFATPLPGGSLGALVNGGLEGFVRNAASELPRGLRINLVSPGWIEETLRSMGMDATDGTPVSEVARAYLESVQGTARGQTFRP